MPRASTVFALIIILVILASGALIAYNYLFGGQTEDENYEDELLDEYKPLLRQQRPMIYKKDDFRQLSPWQQFVTPDDPSIVNIANGVGSIEDAYKVAKSWTWVSDTILNNESEKWLMPHEFIVNTPDYPSNPASGRIVSDCEEQAYTFVSLLRAFGIPATDVRVVVGEIVVEGEKGGHAWVEILHNGKWLQLEATSGPYWDEEANKLVNRRGGGFLYYIENDYPVEDTWGYFNDMFYYNPIEDDGNAPDHWKTP